MIKINSIQKFKTEIKRRKKEHIMNQGDKTYQITGKQTRFRWWFIQFYFIERCTRSNWVKNFNIHTTFIAFMEVESFHGHGKFPRKAISHFPVLTLYDRTISTNTMVNCIGLLWPPLCLRVLISRLFTTALPMWPWNKYFNVKQYSFEFSCRRR